MTEEHPNRKLSKLLGAVHLASDRVHAITGRTDQTLQQIAELYPDHPDVIAWQLARQEHAAAIQEKTDEA